MMSDADAACVAIAFDFCVKAKKKKKTPEPALLYSELSIIFISFLKFTPRELHFKLRPLCLLLASKIAYAFFFLTVAIFLGFNMPQGRQ
jgi:hypothetical protein